MKMTVTDLKSPNLAIQTNPVHDLRLVECAIPQLAAHECLVHVRATGICGSDVHFWKHGHIGPMIVTGENGLGHESAGVVVRVGEGVTRFKPGDRVALECSIPCSKPTCSFCLSGQYHACPEVIFFSTPPHHGTLRRYHAHPEAWLHALPDAIETFEEGALLEPLAVALAGIDRSGVRLADPVVICGAGPIGLVTLVAAAAAGAEPIVVTDLDEGRLRKAREVVPRARTLVVGRPGGESARETGERIVGLLGMEARVVLECTGVEGSVHSGVYATRFGGTVFVIGVGKDIQNIPFMHMSAKQIDLRFQYRYHDIYPQAIRLVASGVIDLKPLVSHRFRLEDGLEAFRTASDPNSGSIKVQVLDG